MVSLAKTQPSFSADSQTEPNNAVLWLKGCSAMEEMKYKSRPAESMKLVISEGAYAVTSLLF